MGLVRDDIRAFESLMIMGDLTSGTAFARPSAEADPFYSRSKDTVHHLCKILLCILNECGWIGCVQINPLAFWTFEDCFDYINKHGIPYHPLHDQVGILDLPTGPSVASGLVCSDQELDVLNPGMYCCVDMHDPAPTVFDCFSVYHFNISNFNPGCYPGVFSSKIPCLW